MGAILLLVQQVFAIHLMDVNEMKVIAVHVELEIVWMTKIL